MLSVYTRHYATCKHTDIYHRRCRCAKWIQGTLDDGRVIRQAANTRNWEKAELTRRALKDAANPHKSEARTRVTITDAVQCFREEKVAALIARAPSFLRRNSSQSNKSKGQVLHASRASRIMAKAIGISPANSVAATAG